MKITNLKVSNFRNLKNIDINFWNINILTWRNSTWKTNLTQLLTNCLNIDDDVEKQFWKNILTHWPWLSETTINVTIDDIHYEMWQMKDTKINFIKPKSFVYKRSIKKNPISLKKISLDFEWKIVETGIEKINLFTTWKSSEIFDNVDNSFIKNIYEDEKNWNLIKSEKQEKWLTFFKMFQNITEDKIISYDDVSSFSKCSGLIYDFVTLSKELNKKEISLEAIEDLKNKNIKKWVSNFSTAKFIFLLADIQRNENVFKKFNDDLDFFTDGILKKVYINTDWSEGSKWDIYVVSPHWPKDIELISAWTAIILFFVLLKNWLSLNIKSYQHPNVMIFDELDSAIHPSLIWKFTELLKIISNKTQLFITTHSTNFIDNFERKDIYLLKDIWSFNDKVKVESNILSYEKIIDSLNDVEQDIFKSTPNSDLYINWYIDSFFPIIK